MFILQLVVVVSASIKLFLTSLIRCHSANSYTFQWGYYLKNRATKLIATAMVELIKGMKFCGRTPVVFLFG